MFFTTTAQESDLPITNSRTSIQPLQIRRLTLEYPATIKIDSFNNDFKPSATPTNNNNTNSNSSKEIEANASASDSPPTKVKSEKTGWRKYIGMIMTLSASLNFSFGVLFAKLLQAYEYHGNCTSFWRYVGVTVPAIPMLFFYEFSYLLSRNKSDEFTKNHTSSPPISTCASTVSIVSTCKSSSTEIESQTVKKSHESMFSPIWPLTKGDNWKTAVGVFFRGFFAAAAVVLRYYALDYLPIGDTSVISYSTPVIVTIMAHFLLGEKAGFVSFVIAFTTLVGVVVVAKPPMLTGAESFTTETLIGTAFAVASLLCASTQIVLTRKIRSVHFALLTVTVGIIGLTIASSLMLYLQDFVYPTTLEDGLYVLGLTVTSFLGQMSIILALKFEQAGPVSLIRTSDVLFGFILQYAFMNVIPEWTSVVGGILVVGGVLVTGARKWLQMLPEGDSTKRIFRFLLM